MGPWLPEPSAEVCSLNAVSCVPGSARRLNDITFHVLLLILGLPQYSALHGAAAMLSLYTVGLVCLAHLCRLCAGMTNPECLLLSVRVTQHHASLGVPVCLCLRAELWLCSLWRCGLSSVCVSCWAGAAPMDTDQPKSEGDKKKKVKKTDVPFTVSGVNGMDQKALDLAFEKEGQMQAADRLQVRLGARGNLCWSELAWGRHGLAKVVGVTRQGQEAGGMEGFQQNGNDS